MEYSFLDEEIKRSNIKARYKKSTSLKLNLPSGRNFFKKSVLLLKFIIAKNLVYRTSFRKIKRIVRKGMRLEKDRNTERKRKRLRDKEKKRERN